MGLGMGMNQWEWEGMGLKKVFPLISTVNLTFDLSTSKCYQYIFVPNFTEVVNLVKFPREVSKNIVFTNF